MVGGLALAVVLVAMRLASGMDIWPVFKGAGTPFLGAARTMAPGFDLYAILVGTLCHFLVSIAWALPFAKFIDGQSKAVTMVAGALWGLVVWFGMYYLVLPAVGMGTMARSAPVGPAILEHVIFGLAVAFGFLPFLRTRLHPMARAH